MMHPSILLIFAFLFFYSAYSTASTEQKSTDPKVNINKNKNTPDDKLIKNNQKSYSFKTTNNDYSFIVDPSKTASPSPQKNNIVGIEKEKNASQKPEGISASTYELIKLFSVFTKASRNGYKQDPRYPPQ